MGRRVSLDGLNVFEHMLAVWRTSCVNGDTPIDHWANNIVDGLSCLPDLYVPLASIDNRDFEPVLIQMNRSENSFKFYGYPFTLRDE